MRGTEDLTPEAQAEFREFCRYLRSHPDEAAALAVEAKLLFLLLREDHNRLLYAVRTSGLGWLEKWKLLQGQTLKLPTTPKGDPGSELINKPVDREVG